MKVTATTKPFKTDIILLGVHLGQSLEQMLGRDQNLVFVDDYSTAASEVYDRKKLNIVQLVLPGSTASDRKDISLDFIVAEENFDISDYNDPLNI